LLDGGVGEILRPPSTGSTTPVMKRAAFEAHVPQPRTAGRVHDWPAAGAGWNPTSIKDRVRQDTWTCFLAPVVGRPNLAVRAGAHVARLLVTGDRVTGVELVGGVQIVAGHEVVVCAGAIDSSWLLLQSGIGPADELRELGVDVMVDKE